jgi:hypothetical protein
MPLVYNDRIIRGSAWCGDCDHPKAECQCEAWADEAAHIRHLRRMEIIDRGHRHPLRRANVALVHILENHPREDRNAR